MKDTVIMLLTSALVGYLLGSLSPAALVAALKRTDLRSKNTGNLGTTNTAMTFGIGWGAVVLVCDMAKAVVAVAVAAWLFPLSSAAGLVAGSAAVFGHVFPVYMRFRGGKGLAPFLGMMLAIDPVVCLCLLLTGVVMALVVNYSAAMPMTVAPLFPLTVWVRTGNSLCLAVALTVAVLVVVKHWGNLLKAVRHEDKQVRAAISGFFIRHAEDDEMADEKRQS